MKVIAEYIWLDGKKPAADVRGKTRVFNDLIRGSADLVTAKDLPIWGFDGSSTEQAKGHDSDCVLKPVKVCKDPLRSIPGSLCVLVLNEVYLPPGEKPHPSNTRARLQELNEKYKDQEFWFGIEQEYTFMRTSKYDASRVRRPLGFPLSEGEPENQGKYYCGAGADRIFGRDLVEEHLKACLDAELVIAGINAEVMPGQWEYQIGHGSPLKVADDLIIARYLMNRIGEKYGVVASLEPKPQDGDWNGAGAHTNFSTKAMRESDQCFSEILEQFHKRHDEHIKVYGSGIEKRLTGKHETCPYTKFEWGISHRGASIRIPWQVAKDGKGYLEDRRPCANMDPYVVEAKIIETVMEG